MTTALAAPSIDPAVVEQVLLKGDLRQLTASQKLSYYHSVCQSIGLNPLTQPFAYIVLNGKEILYAKKDATDQLRKIHGISVDVKAREVIEGVYVVTAGATFPSGRRDESTGAVAIDGVKGESRANAMMKAETKAKRRVTLSICGLGMLDETEVENLGPTYQVEAPKRIELPEGTVQILSVVPRRKGGAEWAEATYVDHAGEEHSLPTPADGTGAALSLLTQLAEEAVPVKIETDVTPKSKKTVIKAAHRWSVAPEFAPVEKDEKAPAITADQIPF